MTRCQCRPQWYADVGRGEVPVTSLVAARTMAMGLPTRLGKSCLPGHRRAMMDHTWDFDVCDECRWPEPIDGVKRGERPRMVSA